MLPREKQGVVDPELKVYGTNNLRVVDIGIIPIHIAAHTQATAYMIAEKAADLIRASRAAANIPAPRPIANLSALMDVGHAALVLLVGAGSEESVLEGAGVEVGAEGAVELTGVECAELGGALALDTPELEAEIDVLVGVEMGVEVEMDLEIEADTDTETDADAAGSEVLNPDLEMDVTKEEEAARVVDDAEKVIPESELRGGQN
ncbi:hypothetical protein DFH09DRAFT_1441506 [Mycena vulgaris]|nr:hypothetical protein DFH09DRAFT_1441506 [Mycena vulgaris]